jgi:VCBS repeat-containing protein
MAASAPGIAVSFSNTKQAMDDTFGGVTEDSSGLFTFDVMANDAGGNGKSLYSVGYAGGTDQSALLTKDAAGLTFKTATDTSMRGAKIWITADGKVGYQLTPDAIKGLQYLAEGKTIEDSFTYAIQMGNNGALSWATAKVTIVGTNDAPVATITAATLTAVEDGAVSVFNVLANFRDVDGDTLSVVVPNSLPDGVSYNSISKSFELNPGHASFQSLALGGAPAKVTVNYGVSDGKVTTQALITWTVTGTNDAPVVTAETISKSITEAAIEGAQAGTAPQPSGTFSFTDVDVKDGHSVKVLPAVDNLGTLTLDKNQYASGDTKEVSWSYSVDPTKINYLAEGGQPKVEKFTIEIDDGQGGKTQKTIEITVTGTNDAPVIKLTDQSKTSDAVDELIKPVGAITASGNFNFADVDLTDSHTVTISGNAVAGAAAGVSNLGKLTTSEDSYAAKDAKTIQWNYSVDAGAVESLAKDEKKIEKFTVKIDDGHGGTVSQDVTITITGTNDVPVVTGGDFARTITEEALESSPPALATGTFNFTDVDLSDTHTVTIIDKVSAAATPAVPNLGTLRNVVNADDPKGKVNWSYTVDPAKINSLAKGDTKIETFTVTIDDQHGGTVSQDVTITITGTNDAPVVTPALSTGTANEIEGTPTARQKVTASGNFTVTDVDSGDTHTAALGSAPSVTAATPTKGALTLDSTVVTDGAVSWSYEVDAAQVEHLAKGVPLIETFYVDVTDKNGATAKKTVQVTVTGTNDAPTFTFVGGESESNAIQVAENSTGSFLTVTASDPESQKITYGLSAAAAGSSNDNAFFNIVKGTGALSFKTPPDYEFADPGNDHLYKVQVSATDASLAVTKRDVFVKVTDALEDLFVDFNNFDFFGHPEWDFANLDLPYMGFVWSSKDSPFNHPAYINVETFAPGLTYIYNSWAGKTSTITRTDHTNFSLKSLKIGDSAYPFDYTTYFADDANTVDFIGYNGEQKKQTLSVTLGDYGFQNVDFTNKGFDSIDRLEIVVTGGKNSGNGVTDTGMWAIDDILFQVLEGGESKSNAIQIQVAENSTGSFLTLSALDPNSEAITYGLSAVGSRNDNAFFNIDKGTGALSFKTTPDYEFADPGKDHLYRVQVNATDASLGVTTRDVFVNVTNVIDDLFVDFNNFDYFGHTDWKYTDLTSPTMGFDWTSKDSPFNHPAYINVETFASGRTYIYNSWAGKTSTIARSDHANFSLKSLNIGDNSVPFDYIDYFGDDANTVDFIGYNGEQIKQTLSVTLGDYGFQNVDFTNKGFDSIDRLEIVVTGGNYSGYGVTNTGWWAIDDILIQV